MNNNLQLMAIVAGAKLTPLQKYIITQCYCCCESQQQVAAWLNITQQAVAKQLRDARKKLRAVGIAGIELRKGSRDELRKSGWVRCA